MGGNATTRIYDRQQQHGSYSSIDNNLHILEDCREWMMDNNEQSKKVVEGGRCIEESSKHIIDDWIVQTESSPFQLYRTIWNAALNISSSSSSSSNKEEHYYSSSSS